jgi:ATP-binding cassette subfamily C protein
VTASRRAGVWSYVRFVTATAGWRGLSALLLSASTGLVEGVGLLFLVPLLGLVGVDLGNGPADAVATRVSDVLASLGIAVNLPVVLGLFVVVSVLQALVVMSQSLVNLRLESRLSTRLRNELYDAILHADWLFLVRQRGADLAHAMTTEIDRVGALTHQSLATVAGAVQIVVALLVATRLAPMMTAVVCAAGLLVVIAMRSRAERARELGEAYAAESGRTYAVLTDGLAALRTTKSFGAEDRSLAMVAAGHDRLVGIWHRAVGNYVRGKFWLDACSVSVLAVLVFGAVRVFSMPPGALLLLLFIFARTVPRASSLQHSVHLFLHALPAFDRVADLLARCRQAAEPRQTGPTRPLRVAIRLDRVNFSYEPGRQALDEASFDVAARQVTALVGASGAGKTTAADIVLGLLSPDGGTVTIDGEPLTRDTTRGWRTQVAYVSQDPFLFHDTILANLRWAQPSASDAEVHEALVRAGAADFVARLPEGLLTTVGDRGGRLSGGERQRLAIARALLRKPDLLILDEPTSALDAAHEQLVLATIARLAETTAVLLVTHRLSTVRVARMIHVLDAGTVVESGTWEELMGDSTRFRQLSRMQDLSRSGIAPAH